MRGFYVWEHKTRRLTWTILMGMDMELMDAMGTALGTTTSSCIYQQALYCIIDTDSYFVAAYFFN